MSAIDQLLIAVKIQEDSRLEELYKMLKDLEATGGKIRIEIPDMPTKAQYRERTKAFNDLIKEIKKLESLFPELKQDLADIIEEKLEEMAQLVGSAVQLFDVLSQMWSNMDTKINELKVLTADINYSITDLIKKIENELLNQEDLDSMQISIIQYINEIYDNLTGFIQNLKDSNIDPNFDKIKLNAARLINLAEDIRSMVQSTPTVSMIDNLVSKVEDLKQSLENEVSQIKLSFWGVEIEMNNLKKSVEDMHKRPGIKTVFGSIVKDKLVEFKKLLDNNIKGLLDNNLKEQFDSLVRNIGDLFVTLTSDIQELFWEQEMPKEFTEDLKRGMFEINVPFEGKPAQFIKEVIQGTAGKELTPEKIEDLLSFSFRRLFQDMKPSERRQIAQFFGVRLGGVETMMTGIMESFKNFDIKKLVKLPLQIDPNIGEILKEAKNTNRDLQEVRKGVENINTILTKKGLMEETDKKDENNKGSAK